MMLKNEITVPVSEWNVSGGRIPLGYVGDSNVEKVIFSFDDDLPPAVYTIEIRSRRLTGIELLTVEDKALVFNVSADILVHSGSVDLQIVATAEGKTIRHTNIFAGYVYGSIQADGKVPEAEISLFQQALLEYNSKLQQAITAAESAHASAEESAEAARQAQTSAEDAKLSEQLADTYKTLANTAVVHASEYAGRAEDAAEVAEQSADKSVQSVADAGEYAAIAKDHMVAAEVAKAEAVQQALIAKDKAEDSIIAASKSKAYADQTEADAQQAAEARDEAKSAEAGAIMAANTADASHKDAEQAALSASRSAEQAITSASSAASSASNATNSAINAENAKGEVLQAMSELDQKAEDFAQIPKAGDLMEVVSVNPDGSVTLKKADPNPPYDDTEIKTDIENLESKKVGYSEVSGNQLLMYADSTKVTLLAALDLPAAPVRDVMIGGESKVVDGAAIIPYASSTIAGVAKANSYNGIAMSDATKELVVSSATNAQIDRRESNYRPIVPKNLPHAVKSAMSAPISTTDPEWSDAEKLAARERMGLDQTVQLIKVYKTTGDEAYFTVDFTNESNGDGYRYVVCVINTKDGNTRIHSSVNVMICVNSDTITWGRCVCSINYISKHNVVWLDTRTGVLTLGGNTENNMNDNPSNIYTTTPVINKLTIGPQTTATTPLAKDTTFSFYGIK